MRHEAKASTGNTATRELYLDDVGTALTKYNGLFDPLTRDSAAEIKVAGLV